MILLNVYFQLFCLRTTCSTPVAFVCGWWWYRTPCKDGRIGSTPQTRYLSVSSADNCRQIAFDLRVPHTLGKTWKSSVTTQLTALSCFRWRSGSRTGGRSTRSWWRLGRATCAAPGCPCLAPLPLAPRSGWRTREPRPPRALRARTCGRSRGTALPRATTPPTFPLPTARTTTRRHLRRVVTGVTCPLTRTWHLTPVPPLSRSGLPTCSRTSSPPWPPCLPCHQDPAVRCPLGWATPTSIPGTSPRSRWANTKACSHRDRVLGGSCYLLLEGRRLFEEPRSRSQLPCNCDQRQKRGNESWIYENCHTHRSKALLYQTC